MKNLARFAVKINNKLEHDVAIEFYRLATKRPVYGVGGFSSILGYPRFVGMDMRKVCSATSKYHHETEIPFSRIHELADTPSRQIALNKAMKKFNVLHAQPSVEPKKSVKSRRMPVVEFIYPKSRTNYMTVRNVMVIDINPTYITGIEDGKFKRFLRNRVGIGRDKRITFIGFK